jgi:hypothetical protein
VTSPYIHTDWEPEEAARPPLPVALNLAALYEQMLAAMIPVPAQPGERIEARILRMEAIRVKTREVDRIEVRLAREQQFNKRVAINAELRVAKLELERLGGTVAQKAGSAE